MPVRASCCTLLTHFPSSSHVQGRDKRQSEPSGVPVTQGNHEFDDIYRYARIHYSGAESNVSAPVVHMLVIGAGDELERVSCSTYLR